MGKEFASNSRDTGDSGVIPVSGRSPGGENGTYSSILAWEALWIEEPGRLQSIGVIKSGMSEHMAHHNTLLSILVLFIIPLCP